MKNDDETDDELWKEQGDRLSVGEGKKRGKKMSKSSRRREQIKKGRLMLKTEVKSDHNMLTFKKKRMDEQKKG